MEKVRHNDAQFYSEAMLQELINLAWEMEPAALNANPERLAQVQAAVQQIWDELDRGHRRVAEPDSSTPHGWRVNQWLKQAILLGFRLWPNQQFTDVGFPCAYDKVALKCTDWQAADYAAAGFRALPGSIVRRSAYIAPKVVLMPSFVNVGAYVDSGTMVDTWATIGSCAQIGKNCHISGGTGIGGVLEPLQANPVIIEDDCFIGARSEIAEGVIVGQGAVIGMGVFIGASTRIINRLTGETLYGKVPPYSVVVAGSMPGTTGTVHLNCAVIVKQVDARTRSKTAINELLRA